ncbi:MAG: NeuD/PglB/VioB family sugar acetyltransferase [Bacteroidales bacterium]|nr:NeuD/PglB/VioB family sugar acetyltransferase [Bacteroidales bacterium]
MTKDLILIGGGGHCISCIDVIEKEGKYRIAGIIDLKSKVGSKILEYPIIGTDEDIPKIIKEYSFFHITLGFIKNPHRRLTLMNKLNKWGVSFPKIISPYAYISNHSTIGDGTIIMHNALINIGVSVGSHCIINTKAIVEHNSIIGNNTHISTSSVINGDCKVGNNCFIGSNSVMKNNICIKNNIIIGTGSVVLNDIEAPGTYFGNPIKIEN